MGRERFAFLPCHACRRSGKDHRPRSHIRSSRSPRSDILDNERILQRGIRSRRIADKALAFSCVCVQRSDSFSFPFSFLLCRLFRDFLLRTRIGNKGEIQTNALGLLSRNTVLIPFFLANILPGIAIPFQFRSAVMTKEVRPMVGKINPLKIYFDLDMIGMLHFTSFSTSRTGAKPSNVNQVGNGDHPYEKILEHPANNDKHQEQDIQDATDNNVHELHVFSTPAMILSQKSTVVFRIVFASSGFGSAGMAV